MIISGAIRAIRHPERYGPRAGHAVGGPGVPQSRARGLTRAILDTFPVVKFGGEGASTGPVLKDVESGYGHGPVEMTTRRDINGEADADEHEEVREEVQTQRTDVDTTQNHTTDESANTRDAEAVTVIPRPRPTGASNRNAGERDVVPDAIGRETCPICIVDFEDGDDLRVLPCEGHHRFHQQCVDPWLLELSSSCPICRQGEVFPQLRQGLS